MTAPPRRLALAVLAAITAVGLAGESWRGTRRLRANRVLKAVELVTPSAARAGENGRPALARHLQLLATAERDDPTNVGILVAAGGQLLLLGRYAEAVSILERAEALEPRAEVSVHLGRARWLDGKRDLALEDFRRGLKLNPRLSPLVPAEISKLLEARPAA